MNMAENTVWAMMAGGMLSLVLLAIADAVAVRTLGALRNVVLIAAIALASVVLSGWPSLLWPALPDRPMVVLQAALVPLSCALGLRLLGIWTGGAQVDAPAFRLTVWSSHAMLVAALALLLVAVLVPPAQFETVLLLGALLSGITVLLILVVAVRATLLGDPLARWLVLAVGLLALALTGLYLRALRVPGVGPGIWGVTALSAVAFLLIVMLLIIVRNRAQRQLQRLARLETGADPATGLPTGAKLLTEVEHAFWRAGRLGGQCTVLCVYLDNLYALGDTLGRATDNQILAATAARIRRAMGFRCVVGLYHPRCFVIVCTGSRRQVFDENAALQLHALVGQPLQVVGERSRQQYLPQVGLALQTVVPDGTPVLTVLHTLEQQAMDAARRQTVDSLPAPDTDAPQTRW